jgi:DNA-binding NarL/FixJ family response regulator
LEGTSVHAFKHGSLCTAELSASETQILKEKARGLSDLEVASKLFLYEREVRAITQKFKKRYLNAKSPEDLWKNEGDMM